MSIDWNILCDKCKRWHHLGQSMGGTCSFGYGSQDDEGSENCAKFVDEHLGHNWGNDEFLRIVKTDNIPFEYVEFKEN